MKFWYVSATLMVLFLVFAVVCDFIGDQTRAIYNMLWAIFLAVLIVGELLLNNGIEKLLQSGVKTE